MQDKLFRKAALEKLSSPEELDQLMQVTTPRAWLALIGVIALMAIGVAIGLLGKIPVRQTSSYCLLLKNSETQELSAYIYLPLPVNGEAIQFGNPAQVLPIGVSVERGGLLMGSVTTAGRFPVSREQMQRVLENDTLIDELLSQSSTLIEIKADLSVLPKTETNPIGYQWTTGKNPDIPIDDRTPCQASITTSQRALVDLVLRQ